MLLIGGFDPFHRALLTVFPRNYCVIHYVIVYRLDAGIALAGVVPYANSYGWRLESAAQTLMPSSRRVCSLHMTGYYRTALPACYIH
jgi:hypothetical protein